MVKKPERLETMFALEFGQLLENHIFASPIREKITEIICSSLGLRSRQQLAQIFAGYDTPSTANIFELIRTLNNQEFTDRFLTLQTTMFGIYNTLESPSIHVQEVPETKIDQDSKQYWLNEDPTPEFTDDRSKDPLMAEFGDLDFSDLDFNIG